MTRDTAFPSPFGPARTENQARAMARLSSLGFGLWAAVSLIQAVGVWYGASADFEPYRQGTAGFSVFLAVVTALLALWQWKRPNRILPVLGIAWALYELSAFLTSALVGAPLAAEGLPAWSPYLAMAAMAGSLVLHIGGVRGAAGLARLTTRS